MDTLGLEHGDIVKAKGQKCQYIIQDFFDKGTHVSAFIVPLNPRLNSSTWWPINELTRVNPNQKEMFNE